MSLVVVKVKKLPLSRSCMLVTSILAWSLSMHAAVFLTYFEASPLIYLLFLCIFSLSAWALVKSFRTLIDHVGPIISIVIALLSNSKEIQRNPLFENNRSIVWGGHFEFI